MHSVTSRWVFRLAVFAELYSIAVLGWLLLPGRRPVPELVWLVAFIMIFPIVAGAMASLRSSRAGQRRGRYIQPRTSAQPPTTAGRVGLVAVLVVALGLVVLAVVQSPTDPPAGAPEVQGSEYVLNSHGALTPVTREVYLEALEVGQIGFVAISVIALSLSMLLFAAGRARARRRQHP